MEQVKEYFHRVDRLADMYLAPGELPLVALVGPYNSGKSTLVNNLLGRQVSPVDIVPATSVPISFRYGELFSVTARLADGRSKALTESELVALPKGLPLAGRVTDVKVRFNHPLLKRMHLLDTPGMDAASAAAEPPAQLAAADHIVYLLHQRGAGETDRRYIRRLVEAVGADRVSFWINCNLGSYDGTSLRESRRVLREICGREIRVYATDTMHQDAVRQFKFFVRDRAAETTLARVTRRLRELDRSIPKLTEASLRESGDAAFLLRFWEVRQAAEQVVRGQDIIKTMVPVTRRISSALEDLIRPVPARAETPASRHPGVTTPNPAAARSRLKDVLYRAATDPALRSHSVLVTSLRDLAAELDREQFLVTAAGGFSTGKTTFFNALLGESLLPAENRPTTFAITRLGYGDSKEAVITFSDRVVIPTHHLDNRFATICRHELAVLERWLSDPQLLRHITGLEKELDGKRERTTPDAVLREIEALKETFARVKRRFKNGRRPWKSLFRRIPLQQFAGAGRPDRFVVHFARRESLALDLSGPADRLTLRETAGSHLALRVEEVDIRYPADILRTATFVDTPGLDSVYHRHREITSRYLPASDCILFFLHGKHVLTRPDLGTYELISRSLQEAGTSAGKLFVIVNFADTLNERERERVRNHLHANLVRPSRGLLDPARIYLVSALDALSGRDRGPFDRLVNDLTGRIWSTRCAANYAGAARRAGALLRGVVEEKRAATPRSHGQSGPYYQGDLEEILDEAARTMARWRARIDSFSHRADWRGFRYGKREVKKGLMGLARKKEPCPSCRDLAGEINAVSSRLKSGSDGQYDTVVRGLSATTLEKAVDRLLREKRFRPDKARDTIDKLLADEENRLRKALQALVPEAGAGPPDGGSTTVHSESNPNLQEAIARYLQELAKLEQEFSVTQSLNRSVYSTSAIQNPDLKP